MEPDWSHLTRDVVEVVSKKITFITDYIRLRAVCTTWRAALSPCPCHLRPPMPWLMLPYNPHSKDGNGNDAPLRFFFDMTDHEIRKVYLPETCGKTCRGSSKGWLVLQDGPKMSLLNPITRVEIRLPAVNVLPTVWGGNSGTDPEDNYVDSDNDDDDGDDDWPRSYGKKESNGRFVHKIVLTTSSPSRDRDCVVMALFKSSWRLAFCRVGDESWTLFKAPRSTWSPVIDATYHDGLFYCLSYDGIRVYDLENNTCKVLKVDLPPAHANHRFIEGREVEQLLLLSHAVAVPIEHGDAFRIYKLDKGRRKWIKTRSIGKSVCYACEDLEPCFTFPGHGRRVSFLFQAFLCRDCFTALKIVAESDLPAWRRRENLAHIIKLVRLHLEDLPENPEFCKDYATRLRRSSGDHPSAHLRAAWIVPSFY